MASGSRAARRDGPGKGLTDYPRPSVAVDTALLTLEPGQDTLSVLQVRRDGARGWMLPGTFLQPGERLVDAGSRALWTKAGVEGLMPRQLHVLDEPDRDDRGWVLAVAHVTVVPIDWVSDRSAGTRLAPVTAPGRLPYGHGAVVAMAVDDTRRRYAERPDPDFLLPDEFTVLELRQVHEAVAGHRLQKDTFRRAMEPHLVGTGTTTAGARGRPAELFARAS